MFLSIFVAVQLPCSEMPLCTFSRQIFHNTGKLKKWLWWSVDQIITIRCSFRRSSTISHSRELWLRLFLHVQTSSKQYLLPLCNLKFQFYIPTMSLSSDMFGDSSLYVAFDCTTCLSKLYECVCALFFVCFYFIKVSSTKSIHHDMKN